MIQTIRDAMCIGPIYEVDERIKNNIIDFLAQHFSVAIITARTLEESDRLEKLFNGIVGEDKQINK